MNVDRWVRKKVRKWELVEAAPPALRTRLIGESVFRFGTFVHHGHEERIDEWEILDTIGDGSCLVHAFLLLLSETYRSMGRDNKMRVARAFRRSMAKRLVDATEPQRALLRAIGDGGDHMDAYLDDELGRKIALYLGYSVAFLQFTRTPDRVLLPQLVAFDHNAPVLLIANQGGITGEPESGGHFEAIVRHGRFVSEPELIQEMEPVVDRLVNAMFQSPVEEVRRKRKPRSKKKCPSGQEVHPRKSSRCMITCKPGTTRNPVTLRCKQSRKCPSGQEVHPRKSSRCMIKCKPGMERNPDTLRCRNSVRK